MKRTKTKNCSLLRGVIFGVAASLVISIFLALFVTIFINNEYLDITHVPLFANIVMFIAVFLGAIIAAILLPEGKWLGSIAVCGIYYIIALCTAIAIFDGIGNMFWRSFIVCITGAITSILVCNARNKQSIRKGIKR